MVAMVFSDKNLLARIPVEMSSSSHVPGTTWSSTFCAVQELFIHSNALHHGPQEGDFALVVEPQQASLALRTSGASTDQLRAIFAA